MLRPLYDGNLAQFNATADLPAPATEFLVDHFHQAVFANMKGAGKVMVYDYDPTEDSQNMSVFEDGEGKQYLEEFMKKKLLDHETSNGNQLEIST